MENKIWEKNLNAIEKKLPGWRAYIKEKKYDLSKEDGRNPYLQGVEVDTEKAYNGEDISCVHYNGQSYYLSGKYQPSRYARHLAEKVDNKGYGAVVFVIGFSDGRFLKELMRRIGKNVTVLVYEPCLEIFLHALRVYDISELFAERMAGVMVQGINEIEFEGMLQKSISIDNMAKFHLEVMGNYKKLFPKQVDGLVESIRKFISRLTLQWNTMVNFTNQTIYNNVKNLRMLYDHYNFNSLHQKLPKNVPAIIVGAGPSLDKNIDELKYAKGKACIIACDTALKPLIAHGIIPDLFVVVDPKKPMELFDQEEIDGIPMITGLDVPHALMEKHKGKKILYFDTAIIGKILQQAFGNTWNTLQYYMGGIPTGGNVASTAFSAARLMGARTIILMGQDMALTREKEHAEGTFQSDRKFDLSNKNLPLVESIDGEMIPTLHVLKNYLIWFEDQIKLYPNLKVINATEGGAKVHGSRQMTLHEAIERYCRCKREFTMDRLFDKIKPHFTETEKEKVSQWYQDMPKRMEDLEKKVVKGGNDYRKLGRLVAKDGYSQVELKKLLKRLKKINAELDKDEEAALIMDGLRGVEYTLRTQMYSFQDDQQKDLIESARIGYKFMQSMQVVLLEMKPVFQEVADYFAEKAGELRSLGMEEQKCQTKK
ncbi:MAG: motility associated factor glycosyltransferase family protein [Lachnospiraceae bacterium]|nr:motility associated factor glycosyltransferase family protein [Lachnospiraceae bacterium]